MAAKDKQVFIKGDAASVASVTIYPQRDGKVVLVVAGLTKDSDGRPVALKNAEVVYTPDGAAGDVDGLLASSLLWLRQVNDLDDTPLPSKVKTIDTVRVETEAAAAETKAGVAAAAEPVAP